VNGCTFSYFTVLSFRVRGVETSGSGITVLVNYLVTDFSRINQCLLSTHRISQSGASMCFTRGSHDKQSILVQAT